MEDETISDSIRLIRALAETPARGSFVDLKVSQKGDSAAQTLKRIVLSRLAAVPERMHLAHSKGETYLYTLSGHKSKFRFAVTAARNRIPWFNTSEAELERLAKERTCMLVLWNPSAPDDWCRNIGVFCLPTADVLSGLRPHLDAVRRSQILATLEKIDRNSDRLTELRQHIASELPHLDLVYDESANPHRVSEIYTRLYGVLYQYGTELATPLAGSSADDTKRLIGKVRERLAAILLTIHLPTSAATEFVLKHDKTDSVIYTVPEQSRTAVNLGDWEAASLSAAYGDGVEQEAQPDAGTSIEHPYDPTKTKIDTRPITIDLLAKRIGENEVDLEPEFQRKAGLWSQKQKSQLIESLLIRIPLPSFYFDASDDSRWLVVDGLQRLTTFSEFMLGDMRLEGLEYLSQYNGKTFKELPRHLRRAIEESQVTIHLIQPGTPPEVKFNIFRRVNTGGLVLTPQEIRHALNQGPVVGLLRKLANSGPFLEATTNSIPTDRMADREFVLRFLAFNVQTYSEYKISDMDAFLSKQMSVLNKMTPHYDQLEARFAKAMIRAKAIFGKHAFRKLYYATQSRSPINKALFETWSVHLGNLSDYDADNLLEDGHAVLTGSMQLNQDPDFNKAISQGTADVNSVRKRFVEVKKLIDSVLAGEVDYHD